MRFVDAVHGYSSADRCLNTEPALPALSRMSYQQYIPRFSLSRDYGSVLYESEWGSKAVGRLKNILMIGSNVLRSQVLPVLFTHHATEFIHAAYIAFTDFRINACCHLKRCVMRGALQMLLDAADVGPCLREGRVAPHQILLGQ